MPKGIYIITKGEVSMSTGLTCGIELAKYVIELCKCNPGFDLAKLKDLAEKTIECAKLELTNKKEK